MGSDEARVADRFAIIDAIHRYCHGVDRCDIETLQSAFWEDATDDHGAGPELAHPWAVGLLEVLKTMRCTQHAVSNIMVQFEGATKARVQTYCVAYHQFDVEGAPQEMVVGGRYLDALEKRGGKWRISSRVYVMDWNRNTPSAAMWEGGLYDQLKHRGLRFPEDLSRGYVGAGS